MLSVIVPVYNVEAYLQRCLNSLNNQTLDDIEFIIVDDGSTDRSGSICEEFIKDKPKFTLYKKQNGGLMSAWMHGLKYAKGDYIGFVDSDDYIESTMYELLYTAANHNDADIVMCNHYYYRDKSITTNRSVIEEGFYSGIALEEIRSKIIPKIAESYLSPSRCNKIFRKQILEKNLRFCDTRIFSAEDINIVIPSVLSAVSFYYIDRPLYYYCLRSDSISGNYDPRLLTTYKILIEKLNAAMKEYEIKEPERIVCSLTNFYGHLLVNTIAKSRMSYWKKRAKISEVFSDYFFRRAVLSEISPSRSMYARIYRLSLMVRMSWIYLSFYQLHKMLKKSRLSRRRKSV